MIVVKGGLGKGLIVTFAQLQSFVTVARLGSVKGAAAELGVSEAAVSESMGALRRDLGDALYRRAGNGLVLTPGGQRLAGAAAEILGLADQARRAVAEAQGAAALLRVAVTPPISEYVAGPLLEAFTRRMPDVEVVVRVEPPRALAGVLGGRLADVALGPRPAAEAGAALESKPFLRYRRVVVAGPRHRLAEGRGLPAPALAGEPWLVGPAGAEEGTDVGRFLAAHRMAPEEVRVFGSEAAALAAAAAGEGVVLAVAHAVLEDLRRARLVRLDVRGTPADGLWHAGALPPDRRTGVAAALWRFLSMPEALQAVLSGRGGAPAERVRPAFYTTLWSQDEAGE